MSYVARIVLPVALALTCAVVLGAAGAPAKASTVPGPKAAQTIENIHSLQIALQPQVAGDALSESGSSANARQTNAASLRSPHHDLPTLRPRHARSGWNSAPLRGTC